MRTHTHTKQPNIFVQSCAFWNVRKFSPLVLLITVKYRLDRHLVTCSTTWYFMTSINYKAPHYAVFSSLLPLPPTLTEVFLNLTDVVLTLTEVFPCFILGCKANARVKLAKTGHGPHSS